MNEGMQDCGHASNGRYNNGCRCDACRAAHARAHKVNRYRNATGRTYFVDAEPVREHIRKLYAIGYSNRELARMGIPRSTLRNLMKGHSRTEEPVKVIKRETAERVFAIKGRALKRYTKVSAAAARLMLSEWKGAGVPVIAISRETGLARSTLDHIIHGKVDTIRAETLVRLLDHKDDLDIMADDARDPKPRRSQRDSIMATHSNWEVEDMWRERLEGLTYTEIATRHRTNKKALQRAFKKLKERI